MTSRLDELRGGLPHNDSQGAGPSSMDDIEAGHADPESERLMERFNREAVAIQNVLRWSANALKDLKARFADRSATSSPAALRAAGEELDAVEQKHAAVRARLRRIAAENKEFKREHGHRTAVVRTRVVQYKQMGERFIDITRDLEALRLKHREALSRSVKDDVKRANPNVTDAQVDAAMASGDGGLESVLATSQANSTADLRYQVADIKSRNAEIQKLTQSLAELQTMFTDMSILVEGQQELINNVEYNVQETKVATKGVVEELETARKYQKKRNKKKICICTIVAVILIVIALIVVLSVGKSAGWFNSNKSSSNNSSSASSNNGNSNNTSGNKPASSNTSGSGNTAASAPKSRRIVSPESLPQETLSRFSRSAARLY
jgi:t-SNARE complex subunit (syntaxin)